MFIQAIIIIHHITVSLLSLLFKKLCSVGNVHDILLLDTYVWLCVLSMRYSRLYRLLHRLLSWNSQDVWVWCLGIFPHFCWFDRLFLAVFPFLFINYFLSQPVLFKQLRDLNFVVEGFDVVFRIPTIQELEVTLWWKGVGIIMSLWSI